MVASRSPVMVVLIVLFLVPLGADPADELLAEVEQAVLDESYSRAIAMLEQGKSLYPGDYRFPVQAGDLYRDRELYRLALAEYSNARELDPDAWRLLKDVAEVYGYLGDNRAAVTALEELQESISREEPDDEAGMADDVIDDLSWMYFKTHRMEDGIRMLEEALEEAPGEEFNRNWAHTLGTLYSGIYNYDRSRHWYMKSIDDALKNGDDYFASIAYYNLSLLDFTFYRYEDAALEARRSLELRTRAGGHMVLGELDFLAWNLDEALDSFRLAESLDETPLARMDIASFYRRVGQLDRALVSIKEIEDNEDESWMYHYGLDSLRFDMDISGVAALAWKGKAEVEALTPGTGIGRRMLSLYRRLIWRIKGMYHDRLNRALTGKQAEALRREGNDLDAAWNYAQTYRDYRRQAMAYLEEARALETLFAPEAEAWYMLEMGVETGDTELILSAMDGFAAFEQDPYERSLREAALLGQGRRELKYDEVLAALYAMNPGGMRQYGLSLPVRILGVGRPARRISRQVGRLLRRTGYKVVDASGEGADTSVLTIKADDEGALTWYLSDPAGATRVQVDTPPPASRRDLAPLLAEMLDNFYTTPVRRDAQ